MTQYDAPDRLSAADAQWFVIEDATMPMHVGTILHYADRITRSELMDTFGARLAGVPRLRQRIAPGTTGTSMPRWEDDPHFELGRHVDEVTLRPPGDDHVLGET